MIADLIPIWLQEFEKEAEYNKEELDKCQNQESQKQPNLPAMHLEP